MRKKKRNQLANIVVKGRKPQSIDEKPGRDNWGVERLEREKSEKGRRKKTRRKTLERVWGRVNGRSFVV
jgi:hypothetical protein